MSGVIGDSFDQRKVLTMAYIGLGISFFALGLPGFWDMSQGFLYYYFIAVMILIGALNALLWPSFISILGHWFPKKTRGFLAGLWSTCNNSGNIIGIQLASYLMKNHFEEQWQYLLLTIGLVVFAWAFVLFFFLVPEPQLIGIQISEHANLSFIEPAPEEVNITHKKQIRFMEALKMDRVGLYASCYFCTKLAVYCLLLWLPTFLTGDSVMHYTT